MPAFCPIGPGAELGGSSRVLRANPPIAPHFLTPHFLNPPPHFSNPPTSQNCLLRLPRRPQGRGRHSTTPIGGGFCGKDLDYLEDPRGGGLIPPHSIQTSDLHRWATQSKTGNVHNGMLFHDDMRPGLLIWWRRVSLPMCRRFLDRM